MKVRKPLLLTLTIDAIVVIIIALTLSVIYTVSTQNNPPAHILNDGELYKGNYICFYHWAEPPFACNFSGVIFEIIIVWIAGIFLAYIPAGDFMYYAFINYIFIFIIFLISIKLSNKINSTNSSPNSTI